MQLSYNDCLTRKRVDSGSDEEIGERGQATRGVKSYPQDFHAAFPDAQSSSR